MRLSLFDKFPALVTPNADSRHLERSERSSLLLHKSVVVFRCVPYLRECSCGSMLRMSLRLYRLGLPKAMESRAFLLASGCSLFG